MHRKLFVDLIKKTQELIIVMCKKFTIFNYLISSILNNLGI